MSENKRSPLEVALLIISIVSAIAFLAKIFGRGEEEQKAITSRRKLYRSVLPSYPDHVYKDYADTLDTALLRATTEDEDAVYSVFGQMKNISDVNKLIEAFATRRQIFSTLYLTLPQAITETFSNKEKKTLNDILSAKGIDYHFN